MANSVIPVNHNTAMIRSSSDEYSSSKAYEVGDLVIYNNKLYRCITKCSAGSWTTNQSCFTVDTLVNALGTKISSPNNNNFMMYFPSGWNDCYLETRNVNIDVPANGDADIAITFNIPNLAENVLPKIFLTPTTSGGNWGYFTYMVSQLTQTSCFINVHNLDNHSYTVRMAVMIIY